MLLLIYLGTSTLGSQIFTYVISCYLFFYFYVVIFFVPYYSHCHMSTLAFFGFHLHECLLPFFQFLFFFLFFFQKDWWYVSVCHLCCDLGAVVCQCLFVTIPCYHLFISNSTGHHSHSRQSQCTSWAVAIKLGPSENKIK